MEPNQQPINNQPPVSPIITPHSDGRNDSGEQKKAGPVIAIVVIVIVLVIAAIYIFASRSNDYDQEMTGNEALLQAEVQPVTNTSDNVDDLYVDLEMSTDGIDEQNF